jgi:hypothetical protein
MMTADAVTIDPKMAVLIPRMMVRFTIASRALAGSLGYGNPRGHPARDPRPVRPPVR